MSILPSVIEKSFWALPIHECLNILETSHEGLSEEEAKKDTVSLDQILFLKNRKQPKQKYS